MNVELNWKLHHTNVQTSSHLTYNRLKILKEKLLSSSSTKYEIYRHTRVEVSRVTIDAPATSSFELIIVTHIQSVCSHASRPFFINEQSIDSFPFTLTRSGFVTQQFTHDEMTKTKNRVIRECPRPPPKRQNKIWMKEHFLCVNWTISWVNCLFDWETWAQWRRRW